MKIFLKVLLSIILLFVVVGVAYLQSDLRGEKLAAPSADPNSVGSSVVSPNDSNTTPTSGDIRESQPDSVSMDSEEGDDSLLSATARILALPVVKNSSPSTAARPDEAGGDDSESDAQSQDTAQARLTRPKGEAVNSTAGEARDKSIADAYGERLEKLPTDMTAYERKVALREIRLDICEKYHIRQTDLHSIASRHGVKIPQ